MRKSICLALASSVSLLAAAAQSAPTPNLVLACPDASAIGQPGVDSCGGYTYEIATNQRIVSTGSFSSNYWLAASDLGGPNTVLVCTLPVEPGTYSSCRDALGVRRTAYVPKDSVLPGGVVTVSKVDGDYADPITAAENAFAGDTWCVAPAWPLQPCVMEIGKGVFILSKTLSIPEGLVVAGALKGDTLLVADNGVAPAVSTRGNNRITDLTIVNSQPGLGSAVGFSNGGPPYPFPVTIAELNDVAIHVSGAARNVAVSKGESSLDILDSELTAVGEDSTAINSSAFADRGGTEVTIERSHVSADTALNEPFAPFVPTTVRFVDSQVFGAIVFDQEESLLEIVRSGLVGNLTAMNDRIRVVIQDSSITGNATIGVNTGPRLIMVSNTKVEGNLSVGKGNLSSTAFDRLTVHGRFLFTEITTTLRRSYIVSSATAQPALSLGERAFVELDQTFVQGAVDSASPPFRPVGLNASSSVLAGPVSVPASCTDTYGADYELLDASCQPPQP